MGFAFQDYADVTAEMGADSTVDMLERAFELLNDLEADVRQLLRSERPARRGTTARRTRFIAQPGRERSKPKKRKTAYQVAYGKAFKRVAPNFKKKDGGWKKGGFAAAGRAARRDPAVRKVKKK